jgi:sterol desaturase/sphingolipid hydroxylase (fatty acid hydroxylase superfamily)
VPSAAIAAEPLIRLGCFLGVLAVMALWEAPAPRRPQPIRRLLRWPNNLGLAEVNMLVVRLMFPLAGVGVAVVAQTKGWGAFNIVSAPEWFAIPAAVLLLNLAIYGQHVMFHAVPLFWPLS